MKRVSFLGSIVTLCILAIALSSAAIRADEGGAVTPAMLQSLLGAASLGFSGITLTKDDGASSPDNIYYDVNNPPAGFLDCSIQVTPSDTSAHEICAALKTTTPSMALQAEANAELVLRASLSGWAFHVPDTTHSPHTIKELSADDPATPGRSMNVRLALNQGTYRLTVGVANPSSNVSYP